MNIRDEGVVLDSRAFRDRDLIVVVLTPHYGVIRGVFRRARGGRAPRAAAAQVLSLVRCSAFQGAHAEMATIRELELIRSSFSLTSDLEKSTAAGTVAEMLVVFCPPGEPAPKQFRLASAILDALLSGIDPNHCIAYTQLWILKLGGWLPPLDQCASCHSDLSNGHFAGANLGLLCRSCASSGDQLQPDDIAFISTCLTSKPEQMPSTQHRVVGPWLDGLVRSAAETRLRALDFHRSLERGEPCR